MTFRDRHNWANKIVEKEGWPLEYTSEEERLLHVEAFKGLMVSDPAPLVRLLETQSRIPLLLRVTLIDLFEGNGLADENLIFKKADHLKGNKKSTAQVDQTNRERQEIAAYLYAQGVDKKGQYDSAISAAQVEFSISRSTATAVYTMARKTAEDWDC